VDQYPPGSRIVNQSVNALPGPPRRHHRPHDGVGKQQQHGRSASSGLLLPPPDLVQPHRPRSRAGAASPRSAKRNPLPAASSLTTFATSISPPAACAAMRAARTKAASRSSPDSRGQTR